MSRTTKTVIVAGLALSVSSVASAQHVWSNSGGGSWFVGGNWNLGTVPAVGNMVQIGAGGTYTVSMDTNSGTSADLAITNANATLAIESGRSYFLNGGIVNDGLIVVNPSAGTASAYIRFDNNGSSITGNGVIMLNGVAALNDAYLTYGSINNIVTQGPGHTIMGSGEIYTNMNNLGTILATGTGNTLHLRTTPKVNSGMFTASNDGTLQVSVTVDQTGGGVTTADNALVMSDGATWNGGTLQSINGGEIAVTGTSTMNDVVMYGDVNIDAAQSIYVQNNIENNGVITVNTTGGTLSSTVRFDTNGASILGNGMIVLNAVAASNDAYLTYGTIGNVITHGPDHTITGNGEIYTNLINEGTILATGAGNTIDLRTTPKTNNADIIAENGGTILLTQTIDQTGGGLLTADNGTIASSNGTVVGGVVQTMNGGSFQTDGSTTFDNVTLNGEMDVNTNNSFFIKNDLVNNGTIVLNPTGGTLSSIMRFDTPDKSILGTGTIVLAADQALDDAYLTYGTISNVITHGTDHTITGNGEIYTNLINEGTITADGVGNTISLRTTSKTNNSLIQAINGGEIFVNNITINQNGGGQLVADTGGFVSLNGATVDGGLIDASGSFAQVVLSSTIDDIALVGTLNVNESRMLFVKDVLTNNGSIIVNPTGGELASAVRFDTSGTVIDGNGEIVLNADIAIDDAYLTYGTISNVITNGENHTIRGSGEIRTNIDNRGLITADVPGKTLHLETTDKANRGTIRADAGTLAITGITVDQSSEVAGTIDAINGGVVFPSAATIVNGFVNVTGGQMIIDNATAFDGVTTDGPIHIPGAEELRVVNLGFTNNGTIHVNSDDSTLAATVRINTNAVTIDGTGEIVLDATAASDDAFINYGTITFSFVNGPQHTISGSGEIRLDMQNEGTLSPGHATLTGDQTQTLYFNTASDITCTPSSVINIELEGDQAGEYDSIEGSSSRTFQCGGTLNIEHLGGYAGPAWGTTIDIIIAPGGVTGQFDTVNVPSLGSDRYELVYLADRVRLLVTCYADCDANSTLNIFDYICFGNAYAGSPTSQLYSADCDGSGSLNIFDYICFGNAYAAGCP
ncbi:MAG: hypothetical protein H6815_00855 [Phycisphaeraceae bacterium]|nr:hypothetical protein [Phycisphaerales bacterium]MCB9858974.1 hypothetical protein [Phycisphaeraceae bacterium]